MSSTEDELRQGSVFLVLGKLCIELKLLLCQLSFFFQAV